MIDADVSYLEQFSGPARNSDEFMKTKTYKVSGCIITAHLDSNEKTIQALTLNVSDKCTIDANIFLKNTHKPIPSANKITFGAFDESMGGGKFFLIAWKAVVMHTHHQFMNSFRAPMQMTILIL